MGRAFQEPQGAAQRASLRGVAFGTLARQKLDIYLPKGRKPQAVVVFFYGGGWTTGSRAYYRLLGAAFTGRGYALVVPDYRLYPAARFPAFVEDAALALKWVSDNHGEFGGAPVFAMGHSAGAHSGALIALDARYLEAHGIRRDFIRGFIGISGPYTLDPAKWPVIKEVFATATTPESARPIKLVRERTVPMLLLHGTRDRVVGAASSERFATALRERGSAADAKVYPRIGHFEIILAFAWGWRWRAKVLDDVDAFIRSLI
jgi:acetyl esterase/lipase